MQQAEMEKRCREAVDQIGDKSLNAVVMLLAGLEYNLHEWIHGGHENTEELGHAIGQCYAGLKMLELYTEANPGDIDCGIQEVLSYA